MNHRSKEGGRGGTVSPRWPLQRRLFYFFGGQSPPWVWRLERVWGTRSPTPPFLLALCLGLCLSACGGEPEIEYVYADLPVEFDGDGDQAPQEVSLALGVLEAERFDELAEGDEVLVIRGIQGGTWIHLSVQAGGLPPEGLLEAGVRGVGEVRYNLRLQRTPEGLLEAHDIPVSMNLEPDDLEAMFGTEQELYASFTVGADTPEEQVASASVRVKVERGF